MDITSEDRLILLLARGELEPPMQDQAIALLARQLRWDLILERATVHEVYPLIYRNLRYLLRRLLVPTLAERRLCRLPSPVSFLYYPLRPLRLGCKWGRWLARTAWQRRDA